MKIILYSVLSGKVAGYLKLSVRPEHTVQDLLELYCLKKDVNPGPEYVVRSVNNLLVSTHNTLREANIQDGDILTIGLAEDEDQTFSFGNWWCLLLASFFIGCVGLTYSIVIFLMPIWHNEQKVENITSKQPPGFMTTEASVNSSMSNITESSIMTNLTKFSHPLPISSFIFLLILFSSFILCAGFILSHSLRVSRKSSSYQRVLPNTP